MKPKKYRLIAIEDGRNEGDVAESDSPTRLINRAIKEIKALSSVFEGNVTWFVLERDTDQIWFHVGVGRAQSL